MYLFSELQIIPLLFLFLLWGTGGWLMTLRWFDLEPHERGFHRVWDRAGGCKLAGEFYGALPADVYCLLGLCLADLGVGSCFCLAIEA